MKISFKQSLKLTLGLSCALFIGACGSKTEEEEEVAEEVLSPNIWVVEDINSKLYVMGSVPMVPADIDWKTEAVRSVLRASDQFFLEVDGSDGAKALGLMVIQEKGLFPQGDGLPNVLSAAQMDQFAASVEKAQIPLGTVINLRPWFASEMLAVASADAAGLKADLVPDVYVLEWARGRNLPIIFLDEVDSKISEIAELPEEVQIEFLTNTMNNYDSIGRGMKLTAENWVKGDLVALRKSQTNIYSQLPEEVQTRLINERSKRWLEPIGEFMSGKGNGMMLVSMPNLSDPQGLLYMLRDEGYTITRYTLPELSDETE